MDVESLSKKIRATGIFPIQVAVTHHQDSDMRVTGSLEDYLAAVQALKSPVVFIGTFELAADDFIYDGEDDDDLDEESEEVDLRKIEPKLRSYSARIGETGWFQLAAPMSNGSLTFSIEEEWWTKLYELLDAAKESVQESWSAAKEELDAEEERRKSAVLKKVQSLIGDVDFQKLKTQKAMREYALEKFPDLIEWDGFELKEVIQNLAARIEAKGLGRK